MGIGKDVALIKALSGGGYTLPPASKTALGGVKAEALPASVTNADPVYVNNDGTIKVKHIPIITVTDNPDGTSSIDIS